MNKKKLLICGLISAIANAIICLIGICFDLTHRNMNFFTVGLVVGGATIVIFLHELEKGIVSLHPLVKFVLEWPQIVWCVGVVLCVVRMLLLPVIRQGL